MTSFCVTRFCSSRIPKLVEKPRPSGNIAMENFLEKRSITVEQNEDVKYFYVKSQIFLITKTSILSDHENVVFDLFISYFRRYKKRV